MELFFKHKIVILRTLGAFLLLVGFAIHFWSMPKKGLSENERAAANVARMEAKVKGSSNKTKKPKSNFLEKLKKRQEKQMQYLTIFAMILGVGSILYTFIPKKEQES